MLFIISYSANDTGAIRTIRTQNATKAFSECINCISYYAASRPINLTVWIDWEDEDKNLKMQLPYNYILHSRDAVYSAFRTISSFDFGDDVYECKRN